MKLISNYESIFQIIETDPFNHYKQAPIYMVVDWENKTVDIVTKYNDGTQTSRSFHNYDSYYKLPDNFDVLTFQEEFEESELRTHLEDMGDCWKEVWNGNNYVGIFDNEHCELEYFDGQIVEAIDNLDTIENLGIWDADEWFCNSEDDLPYDWEYKKVNEIVEEMLAGAEMDNVLIKSEEDLRDHVKCLINRSD